MKAYPIHTDERGVVAVLRETSAGVLVLVETDDFEAVFAAQDFLGLDSLAFPRSLCSAGALVQAWACEPRRTAAEVELARDFLAAWPRGPQLGGRR